MRRVDIAKLVLSLFAVAFLGYGIRTNQSYYRWGGIICLAIAVSLRFAAPRRPL